MPRVRARLRLAACGNVKRRSWNAGNTVFPTLASRTPSSLRQHAVPTVPTGMSKGEMKTTFGLSPDGLVFWDWRSSALWLTSKLLEHFPRHPIRRRDQHRIEVVHITAGDGS